MAKEESQYDNLPEVDLRSYRADDREAVARLYTEGLLAGQIPRDDTRADIDDIENAYFSEDYNHFWIVELEGRPIGMIGVIRTGEHKAEIRRLRVEPKWQKAGVAARLVETAIAHCKHHGYLKVVLETRFDPDTALDLFERFGFQHNRTKNVQGKEQLEFYLDLYRPPQQPQSCETTPPNAQGAV